MTARRPIVFLGPSLARDAAEAILPAEIRPPAAQGDIHRAALDAPPAIALIDGVFKDSPTVRHREILWALSRGIPVYGASSMGALRAAELVPFGMIGVGLIYRWYRRFDLLPDDAVAVTHAPPEIGGMATSDALVDIRRTIRAAERAGHLEPEAARETLGQLRDLPFPERRLPKPLEAFRVRQKEADARALLAHMGVCLRSAAWPRIDRPPPPVAHAWLDDLSDSGLPLVP